MGRTRFLVALMIAVWLWPGLASAKDVQHVGERLCTLAGHADAAPAAILARRAEFDCGADKMAKATHSLWLVADIGDLQDGMADPVLRVRTSRHGAATLSRVFDDGSIVTTHHSLADMTLRWRSPYAVQLPLVRADGARPRTILLNVEDPFDPSNWYDIEVLETTTDRALAEDGRVVSALVAGLLFAPLLLNLVFYSALRQRFILFHTLMVVAIIVNHVFWTGQIFDIVPSMTMVHRSIAVYLALAVAGFAGSMLVRSLCDPARLGIWGRRSLLVGGTGCLAITVLVMLFSPMLPLVGARIFHTAYGLMVLVVIVNLVRCALLGDRMAQLQLLGLSGIAIVAASRILRAIGLIGDLPILDLGFYFAVLTEAFATSIVVSYRALLMRRQHDRAMIERQGLQRLADTDELTGIMNRRAFLRCFDAAMSRDEQRGQQWSLMVIDIDRFKLINDRFGHDAGDRVIKRVVAIIGQNCRDGDLFARFGGEEFVLLVATPGAEDAVTFADRLRERIAAARFGDGIDTVEQVTVSIGIVSLPRDGIVRFDACFRATDQALYAAKIAGRNRVERGREVDTFDTAPVRAAAECQKADRIRDASTRRFHR